MRSPSKAACQRFLRRMEAGLRSLGAKAVGGGNVNNGRFLLSTLFGPLQVHVSDRCLEERLLNVLCEFQTADLELRRMASICTGSDLYSGRHVFSGSDGPITEAELDEWIRFILTSLGRLRRRTPDPAWQPMVTAPKDGTAILVQQHDEIVYVCWGGSFNNTWKAIGHLQFVDHPLCWMPAPELAHPSDFPAGRQATKS